MLALALALLLQDLTVKYDANDPNVAMYSFDADYPDGAVLTAGIIEAEVFWREEKLERAFTRQPRTLHFEVTKKKAQARDVSWRAGWCLLKVQFEDDQPSQTVAEWMKKNQPRREPFQFVVHLGDARKMFAQLPERLKKTREMIKKAREKVDTFKKLTENEKEWTKGKTSFLGQGADVKRHENTVNGMIYAIQTDRGKFLPGAIEKVREVLTTITAQENMLKVGADGSMIPASYHKKGNDPAATEGGPMQMFTGNLLKDLDVAEAIANAELAVYGFDFLLLTLAEVQRAMAEAKLATRWRNLKMDSKTLEMHAEAARDFKDAATVERLVKEFDQFQTWVSMEKPADELKTKAESIQKSVTEALARWAPWREGSLPKPKK